MRLVVVAVSLTALAIPASAQIAPPQRKAGSWQMTMTGGGMPKPMVSTFCTDPTVEKKMSAFGQATAGQTCSQQTVGKDGEVPTTGRKALSRFDVLERIEEKGDLFAEVLELEQELPAI